ncbi:MAG: heat-inducible transcriptional repressor HrcA [bacterium]|nr:heat-inducible transcriptional repressor HrcA [bacterium]
MLNDRRKEILKIIVEEYIKTVKPVGSNSICQALDCSSATVRNEMMYLEDNGLLEKTHTSSGRVPSEGGYRYYVNNLMEPQNMTGEEMLKLQQIFHNNAVIMNDAIKKSIELVSDITNYTAVVLGNNSLLNCLKKVETIPLDEGKILTMVITDKGHVEYKTTVLPPNISKVDVKQTVDLINKLLVGTPISEISSKLEFEVKPIIGQYVKQYESLYDAFYKAFSEISNKPTVDVQLMGRSHILEQPEYNNVDKVKQLLYKLDDVKAISEMKEENNGINIYIGKENQIDDDVAVVKTKYSYNGDEGTIAIIGPKRMNYAKVVGVLDFIKSNIDNS